MTSTPGSKRSHAVLAGVQPAIAPAGRGAGALRSTLASANDLARVALELHMADLVVLPELLNVFGLEPDDAVRAAEGADEILAPFLALSSAHPDAFLVVPVLERRDGSLRNAAVVLHAGERVGQYDKTHLAIAEVAQYEGLVAGDTYPVFDAPFGRFGIMTCFDSYFPEVGRVYAGEGADILCYPSWQSGPSELFFEVQLRARAIDNLLIVVRSSFGYAPDVAWRPGMLFGRSSVVDRDGTILSDAGHHVGVAVARVDVAREVLMDVLDDGGNVQNLATLLHAMRRPETYGRLMEPWRPPLDAKTLFDTGNTRASDGDDPAAEGQW